MGAFWRGEVCVKAEMRGRGGGRRGGCRAKGRWYKQPSPVYIREHLTTEFSR